MENSGLHSEAFHKDMEECIRAINKKFGMNIKCGLVTLGEDTLMIQLETEDEAENL